MMMTVDYFEFEHCDVTTMTP